MQTLQAPIKEYILRLEALLNLTASEFTVLREIQEHHHLPKQAVKDQGSLEKLIQAEHVIETNYNTLLINQLEEMEEHRLLYTHTWKINGEYYYTEPAKKLRLGLSIREIIHQGALLISDDLKKFKNYGTCARKITELEANLMNRPIAEVNYD